MILAGLVALFLLIPAPVAAQLWSGIINANRAIDWSSAGVPGGIPSAGWVNCTTAACNTVFAGTVTTASLNAAILSAPAQSVVRVPAGTFIITGGVNWGGRSNVVLRGAGPTQTKLVFTGGDSCGGLVADVCIRGTSGISYNPPAANVRSWTAGFAKGTTVITLGNVTGLSVGMQLALDQLDDASDPGSIFVIQTPTFQTGGVEAVGRNNLPGGNARAQMQIVTIAAINGTNVTISPGLYMPNWSAGKAPQAWHWGTVSQIATNNGVENIALDHTGSAATSGIRFDLAYANWVKNIRSFTPNRNHVWSRQSAHDEVRDSYFYGTQGAASTSYGVEAYSGNDILVINNIFQHITTPQLWGNHTGGVWAYNFTTDNYQTLNAPFMFYAITPNHHAGGSMNLMEGNISNAAVLGDLAHGTCNNMTLFRNRLSGRDTTSVLATQNTNALVNKSYQRYSNIIGNVLGDSSYHVNYETSDGREGVKGNPDRSVYSLGYTDTGELYATGLPFDPLAVCPSSSAACTMMRWLNWDGATGTVQSLNSELPTGADFPNSRPASTTLPASFFLSAKPSWWGMNPALGVATPPWPPIGSDLTGGNILNAGGHAYKIPAQLCWENTGNDPAFPNLDPSGLRIKAFDATACYMNTFSGSPSSPVVTNLQ